MTLTGHKGNQNANLEIVLYHANLAVNDFADVP